MIRVLEDNRGATALEAAIVLPIVLTVAVMLITSYDALSSRRAVEVGLDRALRHVAVHSATATDASIKAAYKLAADAISTDAGSQSTLVVSPSSGFQRGSPVQIAVTFTWRPTAAQTGFVSIPMNRTASVTIVN